jgi:hypothetical protein
MDFTIYQLIGPPICKFSPNKYLKMWFLSGRRFAEVTVCGVNVKEEGEKCVVQFGVRYLVDCGCLSIVRLIVDYGCLSIVRLIVDYGCLPIV